MLVDLVSSFLSLNLPCAKLLYHSLDISSLTKDKKITEYFDNTYLLSKFLNNYTSSHKMVQWKTKLVQNIFLTSLDIHEFLFSC